MSAPRLWHPFPMIEPGVYHIRKIGNSGSTLRNVRIFEGQRKQLYHRSTPVSHMRGWEFQFTDNKVWVPYVLLYDVGDDGKPKLRERKVAMELPHACCIEEARYIVATLPYRWPDYKMLHVEYEEQLHSPGTPVRSN